MQLKGSSTNDNGPNGQLERAVLVGLVYGEQTEERLKEYLDELSFLALTAGAITTRTFFQKVDHPENRTYVGKGKLDEIRQYIEQNATDLVIFDDELSPAQQRNIEEELRCKILDRSLLILDIFARRARTQQARTQVELAQLQYLLPRLKGLWSHLDRQKGGIGMRGAGEKEIETDRRVVNTRIAHLKGQLIKIGRQEQTRRNTREELVRVALVGYTNVGKSTLMNVLSKSDVFAENRLFATLDTTVRKVVLGTTPFLLSDTVGFIRKLPHHLIESFRSTLLETMESDLIVHVVDLAHPDHEAQIAVVDQTLLELEVHDRPILMVFNKIDLFRKRQYDAMLPDQTKDDLFAELIGSWESRTGSRAVFISATGKENLGGLRERLLQEVKAIYRVRYPYRTSFY